MTSRPRYHRTPRIPVAVQIASMRVTHPSLKLTSWQRGEARWVGTVRPTDASRTYALEIVYRLGRRPRVFVTAPTLERLPEADVPHRHADDSLCLHLPDEWDSTMSIADTIVPWAALWLYHYELWHATGEWQGGGAHPRLRPRVARRVAEAARCREIAATVGAA
jgi:hypothetical protein